MVSLAADLLAAGRRQPKKQSQQAIDSFQRNADKPCSQCGHPERHKSPSGKCYTSMCTECYREDGKLARKKRKLNDGRKVEE